MELKDTTELMLSKSYTDRFRAEYWQTKVRCEKLRKAIVKYDAGTSIFATDCDIQLLREQKAAMEQYLYVLEVRAEKEDILL